MGRITQNWTEPQKAFIRFVGRGKKTKDGQPRTMQQFAADIGVSRETLYDWLGIPGFKMAIVEYTISQHIGDVPAMVQGQVAVAKGQKKLKAKVTQPDGSRKIVELEPNTNAFNAVMKLMGSVERVEQDSTVEGSLKVELTGKSDEELEKIIKSGAQ